MSTIPNHLDRNNFSRLPIVEMLTRVDIEGKTHHADVHFSLSASINYPTLRIYLNNIQIVVKGNNYWPLLAEYIFLMVI